MNPRDYRRTQRWFRDNPERRREYNRRYYEKTAEARRAAARARRLANPQASVDSNRRFRERNPNYHREWSLRRKVARAWSKWSITCAANRRAMESRS